MNYRVVARAAFRAAGKIVTSSLENNTTPQFWDECKRDGTVDRLLQVGLERCTLGICFGYDDDGTNDYMVGIETDRNQVEGMRVIEIPASNWLVFESIGPVNPTLRNTWARIYGEFLPQSLYKQAALPTMEKYCGDAVDADDYRVEIWIPVVKQ